MSLLCVQVPRDEEERGESDGKKQIEITEKAERQVWSILTSEGHSEIRQWLCDAIGSISSLSEKQQSRLFLNILRRQKCKEALGVQSFARRLVRMLCENAPRKAGKILARRSSSLINFFKGNKRRILQWFDYFAGIGESEHKRGAWSIAQFVFRNRDICWDELEWKGWHGQSPAVVATKPHYFMDLDVLYSVENFIENVPEFWSSEEFAKSVEDGQIVSIDLEYFVEELLRMMYKCEYSDVWDEVEDFLSEEKFSSLCPRLLILLSDGELMSFLNDLREILASKICDRECSSITKGELTRSQTLWIETILLESFEDMSLDEVFLVNACVNNGRRVLRLAMEDEYEDGRQNLEAYRTDIIENANDRDHWAFMKECLRLSKPRRLKLIAVKSWLLHYHLSQKCTSVLFCEDLFMKNGMQFRSCKKHSSFDDISSRKGLETKRKREKHRTRKKKRKRSFREQCMSSSDEDVDRFDIIEPMSSGEEQWLLSTDNYCSTWSMMDLPEHLALYALKSWLSWFISNKSKLDFT